MSKTAKTAKRARPRLRQVPMFMAPEITAAVDALPAALRERAHALHRLVLAGGRTWLDVAAAEAGALRVPLASVLAGGKDKCALASAVRRRAWWAIKYGMGRAVGNSEIARAFGVYPNAVRWGLARREAEIAAEKKTLIAPAPAVAAPTEGA